MSGGIEAIFFDNDGVLVDTEPLFLRATREALEPHGLEVSEAVYRRISLTEGRSLFDLLAERGAAADEVAATRLWRNDRYMALLRREVPVLPHAEDCLAALHGRRPMAIVTSSYADHFEVIHERTGFLRFFEFALRAGDYERHKPHPEPYLEAAERLAVDPARCVVVEDTERGLRAALAAGMHCLAVPGPLSRGSDFGGATAVLDSLAEVPEAIRGLG